MTDKERAIVMAYTGVAMLVGDKIDLFYKYLEEIFGRPVFTHELAELFPEIKEKSKPDFLKLCGSSDRYRWHDLRKDPEDLPDTERTVEVIAKMLCRWDNVYRELKIQMKYRSKVMYGKPISWGVSYPYDFEFETDDVIAWREIEPFEAEE